MRKNTEIMRVDWEFKKFADDFAKKNNMKLPTATKVFTQQLKNIRGRIRQDDIIF